MEEAPLLQNGETIALGECISINIRSRSHGRTLEVTNKEQKSPALASQPANWSARNNDTSTATWANLTRNSDDVSKHPCARLKCNTTHNLHLKRYYSSIPSWRHSVDCEKLSLHFKVVVPKSWRDRNISLVIARRCLKTESIYQNSTEITVSRRGMRSQKSLLSVTTLYDACLCPISLC